MAGCAVLLVRSEDGGQIVGETPRPVQEPLVACGPVVRHRCLKEVPGAVKLVVAGQFRKTLVRPLIDVVGVQIPVFALGGQNVVNDRLELGPQLCVIRRVQHECRSFHPLVQVRVGKERPTSFDLLTAGEAAEVIDHPVLLEQIQQDGQAPCSVCLHSGLPEAVAHPHRPHRDIVKLAEATPSRVNHSRLLPCDRLSPAAAHRHHCSSRTPRIRASRSMQLAIREDQDRRNQHRQEQPAWLSVAHGSLLSAFCTSLRPRQITSLKALGLAVAEAPCNGDRSRGPRRHASGNTAGRSVDIVWPGDRWAVGTSGTYSRDLYCASGRPSPACTEGPVPRHSARRGSSPASAVGRAPQGPRTAMLPPARPSRR